MDIKKIRRLKKQVSRLRNRIANIRSQELVRLAQQLGRGQSERGKEPTYISELLPHSRPISIPNHPGSLKKFTAGNILDALERDILELEEMLSKKKESNHE